MSTADATRTAYGQPITLRDALPPGTCRLAGSVARDLGVHIGTLHRWRRDGVVGVDGGRIRLPMRRLGGRYVIEEGDLSAFLRALDGAGRPEAAGQVEDRTDAAVDELARAGI